MMGLSSGLHWILVLLIVLLIFGTKKLRNIGEDLGGAIKGFKQGLKDGTDEKPNQPSSQIVDDKTVDAEAREKKS